MYLIKILKSLSLTKVLVIALGILLGMYLTEHARLVRVSQKNDRLVSRVKASSDSLHTMKNGLYQKTLAMQSTVSELRSFNDSLSNQLKSMDIKLSRLKYVSQTGINVNAHVNAEIYDSIRTYLVHPKDTIIKPYYKTDTLKFLDYRDKYLFIHADLNKGKLAPTDVRLPIHLTIAGTGGKRTKHFIFFRYGPREAEIRIQKDNPYADITYNKTIELK